MMFSSLRTRLWLSYALLIIFALSVVGAGLILALARNPPGYRQAVVKLRVAEAGIITVFERNPNLTQTNLVMEAAVRRESQARNVRVMLLSPNGNMLADSRGLNETQAKIAIRPPLTPNDTNLAQIDVVRDSNRRVWWYTLRPFNNASLYLVVAVQRPPLTTLAEISSTFRDEVFGPLIEAGGVALVVAFILAFTLGRWIAAPLQRIAESSGKIAAGNSQPIPLEGPKEVQDLALAINEMSHKVQTGQQSQREFVANVSHELKTPLTSIQGFAQAIVDGAASSPEALKQAGEVILTEASRMHRLVMDLLTLARLDAGTADLRFELFDVGPLLQNVVVKFAPQARLAQINLHAQIEPVPEILGDSDRLAQVFGNLVDNALKYTPAGGHVLVRTQLDGDRVVVGVADSGAGIAPDDLIRIFERFYRTDKSRQSGPNRGAGLGLSIARQIIQAHGGTITASSSLGRGSEFAVRLPVSHIAETIRAKPINPI
jgi:signal transduction histidine kinase